MTASFNPSGFSALLMGDESLTVACGDMMLAGGHRILGVITRDATVRGWAKGQEIKTYATAKEASADMAAGSFDWLLSIANLRIIPDALLAMPAKGAINFHDGPLPRYAGLNTPAWAIINGETQHGVSWHMIEGGVDEGDLLAQKLVDIAPNETAFSLNSKCYAAGMESFSTVMAQLEAGSVERQPQDLSQRSYFSKDQRPDGMGFIDFSQTSAQIEALVRGVDFGAYWNPLTTAKLILGGQTFVVGACEAVPGQAAHGALCEVQADAVTLATSDGAVRLSKLRKLSGQKTDLSTLVQVGDTAGQTPKAMDDAQLAALLKAETKWQAALSELAPIGAPLAAAQEGEDTARVTVDLKTPAQMDAATLIAATALTALRGAGAGGEGGDIALALDAPSDLVCDWVPLRATALAETGFDELRGALARAVEAAHESAGFARDLILRDPDLGGVICPPVGISTQGTAVAGTAYCVMISPSKATLSYDPARLTEKAAQLIAARLETGFDACATAHSCADIWALPEAEKTTVLSDWNDTQIQYDRSLTLHAAFEAQAAKTPEATAVVFEGETLSYAALNARANQLADVLLQMGAGPNTPIGLATTRGLDLMVGALGILKAGSAYVPLDPAYPADRIAHYITDSGAPIIVAQAAIAASLPKGKAVVLELDKDPRLGEASPQNPQSPVTPDDLAYLIYTSGSTGTPKGVMVTHANVGNFFAGMDARIDHDAHAVWLAVTSLSFDISVLELFWTLARGFKLVIAGDDTRLMDSKGPIATSTRGMDFNLFYWGNDDGVGAKKYQLLLEGAKFADANGFNAVWTPERHFHAFGGPYPNPSVTGAAVAAVTQNLDVRAGSCVAPLHHPARIAEEWAVIDNMTDGRVGLAIASGWQPDDFILRPENTPPENKPAMYAAIDQLRKLWVGEAVEFPTKDGTPFAVVTQPRPVSKKLPIWVTTAGNPQTWKEAGEIGANVLTHLLGQSVQEVAEKIKIYHAALRDAGHDPADFKVTLMLHTYLAETRQQAEDIAREPMKDYLRSAAGLIKQYAWAFPAFKKPEGATSPFEVDLEGLSTDEMDAILDFAFERYFNDSGLFGTVADGLARTEELKQIGVDEIACLIDYGIAPEVVMEGLKPLAEVLRLANAGAVLEDDDFSLAAQVVRHDVTHMQSTPSMAQMMVMNDAARGALGRLKHLMVGGEALPGALVAALKAASPARLQNMYGPTETTIWSTTQMISDVPQETAPVGTPIANTQVYVLDEDMQPLPMGAPGELWIGGEGVTKGYWQRAEMTAERFVANPFGAGRLYRTGDLVAWRADGSIGFMGRADGQVKIRGHRIELGEIEARMAKLPGVTQAVVIAREGQGGAQLVGYVTASQPVNEGAARKALAEVLPDIMVPSAIVTLEEMPLTPNKKIDRKALPAPQQQRRAAPAEAAPASGTQAKIAAIWSGMLGVADIRGTDNFFALGGHSLLAVQAHRDIKSALGDVALSITDIFRFPTLEGLAAHLEKAEAPAAAPVTEEAPAKTETMSKRRMMRAGRGRGSA